MFQFQDMLALIPGVMFDAHLIGGAAAAGVADYDQVILASHPVGYWRLGESSGTVAADSSGNGLDGTYINAPTLGVPGAIAGDSDTAVTLNGVDESVSIDWADLLNLGDNQTLECWCKTATFSALQVLLAGVTLRGRLFINTDGILHFNQADGGTFAHSSAPVPLGRWVHVVGTKNGTDRHIYFDGIDVTVLDSNLTLPATGSTAFYLGSYAGGSTFNGSLDDVAIYNRALPAAEVQAHHRAGLSAYARTVLQKNPLAYWRFNETTGTTVEDASGNGHTGTLVNTPTLGAAGVIAGDANNRAVSFDGANRYMQTAAFAVATAAGMTIETWVQVNAAADNANSIVSFSGGGAWMSIVGVEGNRQVGFFTNGGTKGIYGPFVISSVWHHIVIVLPSLLFDSEDIVMYLDGVQSTGYTGYMNMTMNPAADPIVVARYTPVGLDEHQFHGLIDELVLYSRQLSAGEVLQNYNAGAGL